MTPPDAAITTVDAPTSQCLPQGATGAFYRRTGNPRLIAGTHTFTDAQLDTRVLDPDLVWDEAGAVWHLYYHSPHGTFAAPGATIIRHATSTDLATWTLDDTPALSAMGGDVDTQPSVSIDPSAPADRRFVMAFAVSGAIRIAVSADGRTFSRVTAPPALTLDAVYPGATSGELADPELVRIAGTYHLWFSSTANSNATLTAKGVGYATSTDGTTWTVVGAPVASLLRASADPTSGGVAPAVIYDAARCRFELWMSNDLAADTQTQTITNPRKTAGYWRATSTDGRSWSTSFQQLRDVVWDSAADGEGLGILAGADVAQRGTGRFMMYPAVDDQDVPSGSTVPTGSGDVAGVMTLNLATRDATL